MISTCDRKTFSFFLPPPPPLCVCGGGGRCQLTLYDKKVYVLEFKTTLTAF